MRLLRTFSWEGWLIIALLLGLTAMLATCHAMGVRDGERDRAVRDQAVVTRAAEGRETAAGERAADARSNTERLIERNRDAELTPDRLPDDAERRRGCRQLREAGTVGVPECRGFEG